MKLRVEKSEKYNKWLLGGWSEDVNVHIDNNKDSHNIYRYDNDNPITWIPKVST